MKFIKTSKVLLSTLTVTSAVGFSSCLISCGHKHSTMSWSQFKSAAENANAIDIVKATNVSLWKNPSSENLKLGKPVINESKKTILVTITNMKPYSYGTFTIKYSSETYSVSDWKFNNDIKFKFSQNNFNKDAPSRILIDITQIDNTIYLNTSDGLFQSTDNGKTFSKNTSVSASSIILITKINGIFYIDTNLGLYTSSDGQKFSINTSLPTDIQISVITKIGNNIYLGTDSGVKDNSHNGLYISTDNGKTFSKNSSIPEKININFIVKFDDSSLFYIGSYKGLYTSNDGQNFTLNSTIKSEQQVEINTILKVDNTIYIGADQIGLWTSVDNGKTFVQNSSIGDNEYISSIIKINDKIYIIIGNATGDGIWYSTDDGKTFTSTNYTTSDDIEPQQIIEIDNVIYIATDHGIFVSTDDGKTFIHNKDVDNNEIVLQIMGINNIIYIVGESKLYENVLL